MKKLLPILLALLIAGTFCVQSQAETESFADQWIKEQSERLCALGEDVTLETQRYAFTLSDGTQAESICLTASGKIRYGRYGQQVCTALINSGTGEMLSPEALIPQTDALEAVLTAYVEEYQEQLNTYLDANDLLPVPLDCVCFNKRGMVIHYSADRFCFFSGNSGAVLIRYDQLAGLLPDGISPQDGMTSAQLAQHVLDAAAEGCLYGVEELRVGSSLHAALTEYGTLTDPDYVENGEIYELESPLFYGISVLAPQGAEDDESALITAVRATEICLGGLTTGCAVQQDAVSLLDEAQRTVEIDAETAEYNRLSAGTGLEYLCGEFTLTLYFDGDTQLLYAAEISR